MNLDKEFNYILNLKKFINKTRNKLDNNKYTNLEYKLKEIDDTDSFTDSYSENIFINPNINTAKVFNLNLNNIDTNIDNHYKDLLDHTLDKINRISYLLNEV